jgi:PAS domain S-box-containing protein
MPSTPNSKLPGSGFLDHEQFKTLINHIPGAVYRCEGNHTLSLKFFSDQIVKMTGYPLDYFMANPEDGYQRIVHPDDRASLVESMQGAIKDKRYFEFEYRIICADGTVKWVQERGQGVYDEKCNEGYVDGCIFDITGRKSTEDILEKREKEIRVLADTSHLSKKEQDELLQRLSLATDSAAIAIWEIDLNTNQVIWDKRMFAMYGYPEGTSTSLYEVFQKSLHPEDAGMMNEVIGDLITGKSEVNGAIYRIILPNGLVRHIESHAIIKKSAAGKVQSLIGTNRDITESVTAEEKLKTQNTMLRDIAFIQSHEVRRPLANILGVIEILKSSNSVAELEIFQHLEESAKELDTQIRNIVTKVNDLDDEAFR